jgi:DNA repair ATPase RecN
MENNNQGNKNLVRILAIALIVSLAANIFLFVKKNQLQDEMQTHIDTLYIEKEKISGELAFTSSELDKYKGISDSLDQIVEEGKARIGDLEKQIKNLRSAASKDASKKKELDEKVKELNALVEKYLERIDQLITENQLLKNQNAELSTQVNEVTSQNKNLTAKVNYAAMIKTEYIKVKALKKKVLGDGFTETSLARKVDKLAVNFSLLDNKLAASGDKTVHVVIVGPDGKTFGNGTFKAGDTLNETEFTSSVIVQYDNGRKSEAGVEYAGNGNFKPGDYKVEIYIDGILSGGGGIVLK